MVRRAPWLRSPAVAIRDPSPRSRPKYHFGLRPRSAGPRGVHGRARAAGGRDQRVHESRGQMGRVIGSALAGGGATWVPEDASPGPVNASPDSAGVVRRLQTKLI